MSTPPHQSNAVGVPTDEPATEDGHRPSKAGRLAAMKEEIAAQHAAAAAKQAERGKRGARERVLTLLDEGSFRELDPFVRHRATDFGLERSRPFGDGVVTGFGEIDGRPVAVF